MFLVLCVCGFRLYAKHLRKKNAQLLREEIARTKLEYFTNVSHELLTPLTVLSCLTDEIEQNSPSGSPITRGLRDNILRLKKAHPSSTRLPESRTEKPVLTGKLR